MKAKKKALRADIIDAIELTISPAGEQSRKITRAIKEIAKVLATKLIKVTKKEKSNKLAKAKKSTDD